MSPTDEDTLRKALNRMAELEARDQVWRDYVAFLAMAEEGPCEIAAIHGWRCPDEHVEQGRQFREKLGLPEGNP